MKKSALIVAMAFVLRACSSPPEPTPFPTGSKEEKTNTFLQKHTQKVPLDRLNEKTWTYALVNYGSTIHQAEFTKFWYLAHHATNIEVTGEANDIQTLKQRLISNGATAEFNLIPNCYRTTAHECPKIVNIVFSKKIPINQK